MPTYNIPPFIATYKTDFYFTLGFFSIGSSTLCTWTKFASPTFLTLLHLGKIF